MERSYYTDPNAVVRTPEEHAIVRASLEEAGERSRAYNLSSTDEAVPSRWDSFMRGIVASTARFVRRRRDAATDARLRRIIAPEDHMHQATDTYTALGEVHTEVTRREAIDAIVDAALPDRTVERRREAVVAAAQQIIHQ